jgi:molybdate/tungstate transport system substrate-binding protein
MISEPRSASAATEAKSACSKNAKLPTRGIALALPHWAERAQGGTGTKRLRMIVVALATLGVAPALAGSKGGTVKVLYSGSLVKQMEHGVGPAFKKATGNQFQGYAMGSIGIANRIKGNLRQGDVFISASPKVNDSLTGAANGDWVSWYITFAQSPLVIGYNASSKFADRI